MRHAQISATYQIIIFRSYVLLFFQSFFNNSNQQKNFYLPWLRLYWFGFKTFIIYVNRIAYLIVHLRRVWFAYLSICVNVFYIVYIYFIFSCVCVFETFSEANNKCNNIDTSYNATYYYTYWITYTTNIIFPSLLK